MNISFKKIFLNKEAKGASQKSFIDLEKAPSIYFTIWIGFPNATSAASIVISPNVG